MNSLRAESGLNSVDSVKGGMSLEESFAWCRKLARRTAGNFYYSFIPLPRSMFRDMCALYAFMRISDDIGDDTQVPVEERRERLHAWRENLINALDGAVADHPALGALADVVRRRSVPREYLVAVLDGVAMDLQPLRFETFTDLSHYCYHVAGAVGLCCIHVWGFRDERAIPAAIDCGLAFQLTNILRDLREDVRAGRVYLPQEDLKRFEYTPADIAAGTLDDRFVNLMQFETARAREHYDRALSLFEYLEDAGKPILAAMLGIYGGLLTEIEHRGYDVYTRRVSLSKPRKLWIAAKAVLRRR